MSHASVGKPIGSSNVPLVQEAVAPFALLINIAPGVAIAVDVTDRAGRLLGIVYGENAQLQQSAPADAHANPANALEVGSFPHVWDPVAGDWNMWREGAQIGVPMVEDTGLNTNPRRYEKDNGFYSAVIARAGAAPTPLWTIATAPARTAGEESTIYQFHIENSTGAAVTAWLEVGGVVVTPPYHVADDDTVTISWPAGLDIGNQDIDLNASVNDVVGQVSGTEV